MDLNKLKQGFPCIYRMENGEEAKIMGLVMIGEVKGIVSLWDVEGIPAKLNLGPVDPKGFKLMELISGQLREGA